MKSKLLITTALVSLCLAGGCSNRAAESEQRRIEREEWERVRVQNVQANRRAQEAANRQHMARLKRQQEEQQRIQQQNYDTAYDREFRQFLRRKGYSDVSALARGNRVIIDFHRHNPNASQSQKLAFGRSLSATDKQAVMLAETRESYELAIEFEDEFSRRLAAGQQARQQAALNALSRMQPINNSNALENLGRIIRPHQQSNGAGSRVCGFKPFPAFGCSIGRCVNGKWEQVCN